MDWQLPISRSVKLIRLQYTTNRRKLPRNRYNYIMSCISFKSKNTKLKVSVHPVSGVIFHKIDSRIPLKLLHFDCVTTRGDCSCISLVLASRAGLSTNSRATHTWPINGSGYHSHTTLSNIILNHGISTETIQLVIQMRSFYQAGEIARNILVGSRVGPCLHRCLSNYFVLINTGIVII